MDISSIRSYAEVLEQGLDFKEYILKTGFDKPIQNVYTRKTKGKFYDNDSLIDRLRKCKDIDVLISCISNDNEYPLLLVEYSTAVPTDDHKMQRSDVYYWSKIFKIPLLKIYPSSKGMKNKFGGGDKITDEFEEFLSYKFGGLFYPVKWETIDSSDNTLKTKKDELSCIYYSDEIYMLLKNIIETFKKSYDFDSFFDCLRNKYKVDNASVFKNYASFSSKKLFVNSERFKWNKDTLISKINRFGHAMDPDRGVLYFTNMVNGVNKCATEIQINRNKDFDSRGGYKSLFDGLGPRQEELTKIVKDLIKNKNNVFSPDDALEIFEKALNIDSYKLFNKVSNGKYEIDDTKLLDFLNNNPSMTSKSIFFLSTKLILTDVNRNIICEITWNEKSINDYLSQIYTTNFKPIKVKDFTFADVNEDIITFSSVQLYKKIYSELVAVSYPGAQGDRCILNGSGKKAKRIYVDIIACKNENNSLTVFLEECKDDFRKSDTDVKKLHGIIKSDDKIKGLEKLMAKVTNQSKIDNLKISIGSKISKSKYYFDVDYIFMFYFRTNGKHTFIDYKVAIIDTTLINTFKEIMDNNKKMSGTLEFDKIFVIEKKQG